MGEIRVRCVLLLEYPDAAAASAVHRALLPDNATFVRARVDGRRIIADMEAGSPMSLLHTVEDYLACVAVAEKAAGAAKE